MNKVLGLNISKRLQETWLINNIEVQDIYTYDVEKTWPNSYTAKKCKAMNLQEVEVFLTYLLDNNLLIKKT